MATSTVDFLRSILCEIASVAAQGCAYHTKSNKDNNGNYISGWTPKFTYEELNEVWRDIPGAMRKDRKRRISISELRDTDIDDLHSLGFRRWDENITLIPLWVFNYIVDGEILVSVNGDNVIKNNNTIDLDVRGGCIAFGFHK